MSKNIMFMNWESFSKEDIIQAFSSQGYSLTKFNLEPSNPRKDALFEEKLSYALKDNSFDFVFSSNFYPVISDVCQQRNIRYVSWVYDNPHISLYSNSIMNSCNFVFLFDKSQYNELKACNIDTVYYLPLGVNTNRLDSLTINDIERAFYSCDVSFTGALYNEAHNLFDRMTALPEYAKGYLDAIMEAQLNVYGYYFIDDVLNENILNEMIKALRFDPNEDGFETQRYVYSNYFIGRKLTSIERLRLLTMVSEKFNLNLYTTGDTLCIPTINNKGTLNYYNEMPKAFKCSKINLNITLRTIKTGIPLRCFDIMGAGGFLLTNYQEEFLDYFVPDEDFAYFGSKEELMDKIDFYLKNDSLRKKIALNGYEKVKTFHTIENRIKEIIKTI